MTRSDVASQNAYWFTQRDEFRALLRLAEPRSGQRPKSFRLPSLRLGAPIYIHRHIPRSFVGFFEAVEDLCLIPSGTKSQTGIDNYCNYVIF